MAGRPKGAKNKRSILVEIIAAKFALDPFEILMMIAVGDWKGMGFDSKTKTVFTAQGIEMEEDNLPIAQRCQAAKEATRYLHAQKQSLKVEFTREEAIRVLEDELSREETYSEPSEES